MLLALKLLRILHLKYVNFMHLKDTIWKSGCQELNKVSRITIY
jgi:hypothetical protein